MWDTKIQHWYGSVTKLVGDARPLYFKARKCPLEALRNALEALRSPSEAPDPGLRVPGPRGGGMQGTQGTQGQMDGQTKIPPVFYRTSSPSGPLPKTDE